MSNAVNKELGINTANDAIALIKAIKGKDPVMILESLFYLLSRARTLVLVDSPSIKRKKKLNIDVNKDFKETLDSDHGFLIFEVVNKISDFSINFKYFKEDGLDLVIKFGGTKVNFDGYIELNVVKGILDIFTIRLDTITSDIIYKRSFENLRVKSK